MEVVFRRGLNVITGETGAGKSIFMGALSLLLGERADRKMIRSGAEQATVEAVFDVSGTPGVDAVLEEAGLDRCAEGQLILRRVIRSNGTNAQAVNDSPATLPLLKRLGDVLLDMHGPHDHQSLFQPSAQLALLDSYGHTEKEVEAYGVVYGRMQEIGDELEGLSEGGEDVETVMDVLGHRIREIEELKPSVEDEEEVAQEHRTIAHAARLLEAGGGVAQLLSEGEDSAFDRLAVAQRLLESVGDLLPEAKGWQEMLRGVAAQVQEVSAEVSARMESIEASPGRLEWLDERLTGYQKLKRKYGGSVEGVLETLATAKERLERLASRGEREAELRKELEGLEVKLVKAGEALRAKRLKAAKGLGKAVTEELKELGFGHGSFSIEVVAAAEPRASGLDEARFGFAPNLGEAMKPLREIASSGEISRVMLATKVVLAGHDRIPLLVFDEVDANVGGEMGHAIGRKLRGLGESHQVVCITHLPQVAACGGTHFAVEKGIRGDRTLSTIRRLEKEERVEEIARMLGGKETPKTAKEHARVLLEG